MDKTFSISSRTHSGISQYDHARDLLFLLLVYLSYPSTIHFHLTTATILA